MKKWWITLLALLMMVPVLSWDTATAEASSTGDSLVNRAKDFTGTPYQWGGTTPQGFDCSGYLWFVYKEFGIDLPRTAAQQQTVGTPVAKSNLKKGDLVFFTNTSDRPGVTHSGMYIGNNKFISAKSSRGVAIESLDHIWWGPRYHSAKRVIQTTNAEVASTSSSSGSLPDGHFRDVVENHWAFSDIKALADKGIISNNDNFRPNDAITRAEAAIMLDRHFGFSSSGAKSFRDVNSSTTGYKEIQAVSAAGIMTGYEDGTFRPDAPITRAEIATILDRGFGWNNVRINRNSNPFSDVTQNAWHFNHTIKLNQIGIISGYQDGTFRPNSQTTRAEFSSLLHRSINK